MSLKDFEMSFTEAIKNQVEEVLREYQTYDEINTEYEDEDIIMKADVERLELEESIPKIRIYVDQSYSFGAADVKTAKSIVATVQKKYVDTDPKLCELEILYFDNYVVTNSNDSSLGRGGTHAWPYILDDIQASGATNVMIITDSDMNERGAERSRTVAVNGCVWFL